VLRIASPVEPSQRLREIMRQLEGIGGGRPMGFGPNRVRSLPDGVAQVLQEYSDFREERKQAETGEHKNGRGEAKDIGKASLESQPLLKIGDLCPECGQAAVVNEEGCRKCYACGYSEC
jgi:ribonucleoside-diphosphate reductase alpha chain